MTDIHRLEVCWKNDSLDVEWLYRRQVNRTDRVALPPASDQPDLQFI